MVDDLVNTEPGDYLGLLMSFPNMTAEQLLSTFLLGLFRLAPIVSIAPFLGSKLPGGVKMGLAVSLAVLLLPQLLHYAKTPVVFNMAFLAYGLKELLMGFILAFLATIPFYIAQGSGSLIDFQRGSSSLQVTDPTTQTQTSSIGTMFNYVLIVLFFQINGPYYFLDAVSESFRILPIDKMIPISFFTMLSLPFWKMIIGLLTRFTAISIQLAAPSLVSILMAEMFLGIANRLAPQVQIVFLGMSLKSLLGLGLLWAGWFFILQQMGNQSLLWIKNIDDLLRAMSM